MPEPTAAVVVEVTDDATAPTVRLCGELDLAVASTLRDHLDRVIDGQPATFSSIWPA